jgi:hypothetical protein
LVEQPIRNRQVSGSSPLVGSITYTVFRSYLISHVRPLSARQGEGKTEGHCRQPYREHHARNADRKSGIANTQEHHFARIEFGLILSDYSASWHRSRGLLSMDVSAGSLSICEFNQPRRMEMRNPASIALVLLRNEILEQALHDSRHPRVELQERHGLQDQTMRHLMEILLYGKRRGFQSGPFFWTASHQR